MKTLLIRHPASANRGGGTAEFLVEYVQVDSATSVVDLSGSCTLHELAAIQAGVGEDAVLKTVILVPDEWVLTTRISLPGRNARTIARAIPFAVEPFLAGELSANHIGHGEIRRGVPVECVVIEHEIMRGLLDSYNEAGVSPDVLAARSSLLDTPPNGISILFDDVDCIVKSGEDAIRVDRSALRDHLEHMHPLAEESDFEISVFATPDDELAELQEIASAQEVKIERLQNGVLPDLAVRAERPATLNLLQGIYAPADTSDFEWMGLKLPISIAVTWVLLALGVVIGQGIWADYQARSLLDQGETMYRSVFNESSRSSNPARRLAERLPGATGVSRMDFLGIYRRFLAANEETDSGLSIKSLSYTDQPRELKVNCLSQASVGLEALVQVLQDQGVRLEVESLRQDASGDRLSLALMPMP